MKCDRRWWSDGAYAAARAAYGDEGQERGRLLAIRERLAWMANAIRAASCELTLAREDWELDIKVVVVVEGLDGTMNERGVQRTLLGISSDEDSLRTEMILKSAAVASWRIDHVDDPRRKRGGR